jgi:uncharacterized protein (DUF1330 family)
MTRAMDTIGGMKGYVVAAVTITDPEPYGEYRAGVQATLDAHGGRFLVRGGEFDVREGEWPRERIVVIEFDSVDDARAWYDSPEYRPLRDKRHAAAMADLVIVAGA